MTYYPSPYGHQHPGVPAGVPADETGVYPALAGYTPMETARRIVVALADGGMFMALYFFMGILTAINENLILLGLLLLLGYAGAQLWAVLTKSSRLAGIFLKATYVDVQTGQRAGGKLFLKFLIQGALAFVSWGLAPLIMYFVTLREPLKRNWFDRVAGLMLVDERTGRPVGGSAPAHASPAPMTPTAPPVAPVQSVSAPSVAPVAPVAPVPPTPVAPASTPSFAPPAPQPPTAPPAQVGIITSVPGSAPATPAPSSAPSYSPPPWGATDQPVVIERSDVHPAFDAGDSTVLAPDSAFAGGIAAWLDGVRLPLTPATVIGRDPVAPGSHPDAAAHPVNDPQASKTHLLLGEDAEGPYVIDLHSTNGVSVAKQPGAPEGKVEAGRRIRLAPGSTVRFGLSVVEIRA